MSRIIPALAGAAIAAAATVFTPITLTAQDQPAKSATGQPVAHPLGLPAGIQVKDLKDADDIRNAFKAVTAAAFDRDVMDNIANRLVDADRTRIGKQVDTGKNANKDLQAAS